MSTIPFQTDATRESGAGTLLGTVDALLRDRAGTLERIQAGENLAGFARAMLATIAIGAGSFGGAMGAWRGGVQIVLAGAKLPVVVLLTAALCAPATTALNAAFDRRADVRRDIALVLASLAMGALVLAALAPVLLLADSLGVSYHDFILAIVGCCSVGGIAGVALLVRGLAADRARLAPVLVGLLSVFALVGSQLAWSGRPWVTRPRTSGVVLLRAVDDQSFLDSVARTFDSATGSYSREQGE